MLIFAALLRALFAISMLSPLSFFSPYTEYTLCHAMLMLMPPCHADAFAFFIDAAFRRCCRYFRYAVSLIFMLIYYRYDYCFSLSLLRCHAAFSPPIVATARRRQPYAR